MAVNSKRKGACGEREAVAFLKSIGFDGAFRSAQANGLYAGDVVIPGVPVHVEVKCGYPASALSVGSAVWSAACVQAEGDADGKPWIVLWRPKGCRRWNATADFGGYVATVAEPSVRGLIDRLTGRAEA